MMKLILTDITTLPELKMFLEELPKDQHDYIDWSSLPTFGGDEPDDTTEVWSWDEENLLVGTCCSDWEIISRTAWTILIRLQELGGPCIRCQKIERAGCGSQMCCQEIYDLDKKLEELK